MRLNLKSIMMFLLIALVLVPALSVFASGDEVMFKQQVDAGYWDTWKHSDGTWQYTGKPGDEKSYNEFVITPPAEASNYENVRWIMEIGVAREQFMEAGGWNQYGPNDEGWKKFKRDYIDHIPNNYRKTGDKEVSFNLSPVDEAEKIKEEDWQADVVEGWRWYLPVTISWYGVGGEKPDFEVKSLVAGTDKTVPGEQYTGTVKYKLKSTADGPKEAILHMTHNGFGLKTPDGGSIHNKILTFQPGEEKTFQFAWSGQNTDSTLRAEIWPTEPSGVAEESRDANPVDNVKEINVPRAGYKLTVQKSGEGTTAPPVGAHMYNAGEQVSLSASPSAGWKFVRWEGDATGSNPNTSVVMDSDRMVKAVFAKTYKLDIKVTPGTMAGTTTPSPGVHVYNSGDTVTVTAIPKEYWNFVKWAGSVSGTNPVLNITMDRDKVLIAEFAQGTPPVIPPGDPGGIGAPRLLPK
ncbi:MAG: InlB B-repeat-containing protein [Dethiobacteria bacterium]|jgi:hypothetical protein